MKINWRLAAPLAGLAIVAGGVIGVEAATPTPAGATNPGQVFIDKLAGILHLSSSQVQTDLKSAELQTIDQMLKDGKITQAQADAMKAKVNGSNGVPGFGFGFFDHKMGDRALLGQLMKAEMEAAANALKITPQQLMSDLKSGKSISDLEKSAGISDSDLRGALKSAAKGVLDPAVKAGTITQAQEDSMLSRLDSGPLFFKGFGARHHMWGGPGGPGASQESSNL